MSLYAVLTFPDGKVQLVPADQVEHLRLPDFFIYQVSVRTGRARRKGRPYPGGSEVRDVDGYFHGPEQHVTLTYKSDLDLDRGTEVLVPVADHRRPRKGLILGRESGFEGDLKSIYGVAA